MCAVAICDVQDCNVVMLVEQISDCLHLFVYQLDENAVGFIEEGEFVESEDQDQGHFVEQGKLLSELAPQIYASIFITWFTLKAKIF